jgi:hypothetical protein
MTSGFDQPSHSKALVARCHVVAKASSSAHARWTQATRKGWTGARLPLPDGRAGITSGMTGVPTPSKILETGWNGILLLEQALVDCVGFRFE